MSAPIPSNEETRLKDLQNYNILDVVEEPAFNEIVELEELISGQSIVLSKLLQRGNYSNA